MQVCIPSYFFHIRYEASQYPGNTRNNQLKYGANCQHFVYEFLRYFGFVLPNKRSSELWHDTGYTRKVRRVKTFDLVLFNKEHMAFGAHIGVCIGESKILHLSKKIGYPNVWDIQDFEKHVEYKIYIGAKRPIKNKSVELRCLAAGSVRTISQTFD
jgi:murein DD-endopeptidase / murein LD-carboxypeptidase